MDKFKVFRAVACGIVLSVSADMALAEGIPVFDISTYTQALENVKKSTEQINHLQTQIQNQIQALEYMKQNLNQFNFNDLNSIQNSIDQLLNLQSNLDSILSSYGVNEVQDFLNEFKTTTDFEKDKCLIGGCDSVELRKATLNNVNDNEKYLVASQKAVSNAFTTANFAISSSNKSYDDLKNTLNKAKLARGEMESLGAIIELLGQQNQVLLDLKNMMASQVIADSMGKQKQIELESARNVFLKKSYDF